MEMTGSSPSKVCLVVDKEWIQYQHLAEVETMLKKTDAEVSLIAIDETTSIGNDEPEIKDGGSGVGKYELSLQSIPIFFEKLYTEGPKTLTHAERYLAENILTKETPMEKRSRLRKRVPIDTSTLSKAETLYFEPVQQGKHTYSIPDDIVDTIVDKTDVVVLLGFNRILRGRILTEPEYGVLSFHGSDFRKYRGRPGGYWQFLNRENKIGLTLQQLTTDLDGGRIVVCKHADISDADTWWHVKLAVTELYGSHLADGIQLFQDPNFSPIELSEEEMGELTFESCRNKWRNEIRMAARNFVGRYF